MIGRIVKHRLVWLGGIVVLVVLVGLGSGVVGYGRGREEAQREIATARDGFLQTRPGGAGVFAKVGAPGDGREPAMVAIEPLEGTIERAGSDTLTVKTSTGSVQVTVNPTTIIRRTAPPESLKAGDRVTVIGEPADGRASVTAIAIEVQGP